MRYDVIVVGAGPAGSTAARECATRGLSVLLLDKAEFPRDKPCGGALTLNAAHLLPFDLDPIVERKIFNIRMSLRGSSELSRGSSEQIVYLTQRSVLDAFLLERAIEADVTLRQRSAVRQVVRHGSYVEVRTNGESFQGSILVAADGANGATSRMAGLDMKFTHGVAIEGNVRPPNGFPERWEDSIGVDFGELPGGYGWLFPKGDHVNVGLGGWRYLAPGLRSRLDRLVRFYGFEPGGLWGLRGHLLPLRSVESPLVDGNVLTVGDAAGLVDPLTGEGISSAISSARIAARHIARYLDRRVPDLTGYVDEMQTEILSNLVAARRFQDLFHLTPGLYHAIERHTSLLSKAVLNLLAGNLSYGGIVRRLGGMWTVVEFLSDLVRTTPFLQKMAGLRDPAPPERFFRRRGGNP